MMILFNSKIGDHFETATTKNKMRPGYKTKQSLIKISNSHDTEPL